MATVYKRGGVWWGRAQRKGQEYRKSLETRDRRTAEKRLRTWLEELEASQWGGRTRVSFNQAMTAFITEHLPALKPSSATRYGVSIKWLNDKFSSKFLDEIGREEMSEFESWRRGLGASNPTIRRDFACLSSIFAFCEDREWIDDGKNPVPSFIRRRTKRGLKEAPARTRYLSEDEEARLLAAATPAVRNAICFAIDTGLRSDEMLSLQWWQIDRRRGIVQTTEDTKNGKKRAVPLPQRSAVIVAQLSAQSKKREIPSLFVFSHEDGKRILRMNKGLEGAIRRIRRAIDAAREKGEEVTDFPDLRWHDLRRTAGCRWLQRDRRSLKEVSELLGHSSVQVTETRYAFLKAEDVAAEVSAQGTAQLPAHGPVDSLEKVK